MREIKLEIKSSIRYKRNFKVYQKKNIYKHFLIRDITFSSC